MSAIVLSLNDMPPDLRHAVQFCPGCGPMAGFPYIHVCEKHQAPAAGQRSAGFERYACGTPGTRQ